MAKKKKNKIKKYLEPDRVEFAGPIGMARFGNFVAIKNFLNDKEHQEFMARLAEGYPDVYKKIDRHVNKICELIKLFDPLLLLQCGFFNYFNAFRENKSKFQTDMDTSIAMRMIDYVQSIIVSTPTSEKLDEGFDQLKWDELALEIKKLYSELNLSFHIYRTAHLKATDENYDADYDYFQVKAQLHWANVRGNRYIYYNRRHLADLLTPHDDILKELFNVTTEQFINGIEQIQVSLSEGLPEATEEYRKFQQISMKAIEDKLKEGNLNISLPELMQIVIEENNWKDWLESIMSRLFKFDLFDVQKMTKFPEKLLRELSLSPGEYKDLFAPGEFPGWPLRLLPIQVRPFLCVDGRYYCFELHSVVDNLYRIMQRLIMRLRPDYRNIWNQRQKVVSEELPFILFKQLLPTAKTYRSIYHQWATGKDGTMNWCETDGLIIFDDHLIIVEIKAGAFTYTPPATDFTAQMNSIKELILKPATQARRFVEYLKHRDEVVIYNDVHIPVTKLRYDRFRHITACCVTLDQFTALAAQAECLQPIISALHDFSIWSISVDDLRVYADIFDSPLMFCHFLEERQRAFKSPALRVTDELDHLCLYLKHNRYVSYAEDYYKSEPARWVGYRDDLDKYFHDLMYSPGSAIKPLQPLQPRLAEIIKILEMQGTLGCCKTVAYLLDMDSETREKLNENIDQILARQKEKGHIIPLSFFGGVALTAFCEQNKISSRDETWKREYVLATIFRTKDPERLMVTIFFDESDKIHDVQFCFLSLTDIPEDRMPSIEARSEKQKNNFLRHHLAEQSNKKIGRNEMCPCASGKKYKRCCGR